MKNSIEKLKSLPGGMMKWYLSRSLKMKIVVAAAFIVLIVVGYNLMNGSSAAAEGTGTTGVVKRGDFVISTTESGEIRAKRSMTVTAPKVGVNLQIIELIPEGSFVKKGDRVVQFDPGEIQKSIEQKESELDIAKADFQKTEASEASQVSQMEANLKDMEANLRLQELQMERLKYESEIEMETGKLRLEQAVIKVEESKKNMESQLKILKAEREKQVLRIQQAQAELEKWKDYLDKLTLTAPADGLVVYQESWNRASGGMEKIKMGDTPYSGEPVLELPDLSELQVKVQVNEVDIGSIAVGDKTEIVMDAYETPKYTGKVVEISTLARRKNWRSDVKVFDIIVDIDKVDERLKPGMTAKVEIVSEVIPDVLSVPIEGVFDEDGKKIVYASRVGGYKKREVTIGKRNDNFVIITDGLEEGDSILLTDPAAGASSSSGEQNQKSFQL